MAEVLNRMGFRLRKVVKAKPQKKLKETDAIFDNIKKDQAVALGSGKRLSIDCKATVHIGAYSRGGLTGVTTKPVIMIWGARRNMSLVASSMKIVPS